jgi:hypothetical protein
MHGLLGLAGLLGLVTLAFGHSAAVRLAQFILVAGALVCIWLAYLIIGHRL